MRSTMMFAAGLFAGLAVHVAIGARARTAAAPTTAW